MRNSTDEFDQYIGNPDLKPSFTNSFNLSNNGYDFLKDRWVYESFQVNFSSNSIINSRTIDAASGKITSKPVNTDGNLNSYFYSGIGFKIKKIDARFQAGPGFNYSRFADITNNILSYSKTFSPSFNLSVDKSKDKKYELGIRDYISYNYNKNSQSIIQNNYFENSLNINATVYLKKVWSLGSDYQLRSRQKTDLITTNLNNSLWNAKVQRTFHNNEFSVYFKVRDILNQNIGIDRNVNGKVFTEVINDRLKRYFLLGFSWDFKTKAPKAN